MEKDQKTRYIWTIIIFIFLIKPILNLDVGVFGTIVFMWITIVMIAVIIKGLQTSFKWRK
jgi:nitrate reductase NapE component